MTSHVSRGCRACNYLGKFVPNLSDITAPLRELLEKDSQWYFDKVHERAFNKLKSIVTSNAVLTYSKTGNQDQYRCK